MYESAPGTAGHECANCGAVLPPADAQGVRTCTFCKATYEAPKAPPVPPAVGPTVTVVLGEDPPTAATGKGCGVVGVVILLVVLLSVGVPIYLAVRNTGLGGITGSSGTTGTYRFSEQAVSLPGEPGAMPSFVIADSNYESGKTVVRLLRFDGGRSEPAWTSAPLPIDNDSSLVLRSDGTRVFAGAGSQLVTVNVADGKVAWQGALSDEVSTLRCSDCFTVIGTRVVARTKDGTLQAYDTTSGAPAWSRRLQDVNALVISTGGVVVVKDGQGGTYTLTSLEPTDGSEVAHLAPSCQRPGDSWSTDLDSSTIVKASPARDALIVALGNSPTCIQGWDARAGALAWNVYAAEDTYLDGDAFGLLDSPAGLVVTARNEVGLIDPARTAYRAVAKADQTEYVTLAATGDTLWTEAKNSRGTVKSSVQAVDLASGAVRWELSLGKATSIDGQEDDVFASWNTSADGTFSAHVQDGRVSVVSFATGQAYESTLTTRSADAVTGAAEPPHSMPGGTGELIPEFGPVQWNGTRAFAHVGGDSMQLVDTATGTVVAKVG